MATETNTGLNIARFRWVSVFNSVRYKDEEDKLNYKIDLNMRYMVAITELKIAYEVAAVTSQLCCRHSHPRPDPLPPALILDNIARDKIPELNDVVRNLYLELREIYLSDVLEWNTLTPFPPELKSRVRACLGLENVLAD
tara:strand:+ start:102 stop:521 length:420 start_codon:yes stop_codon:yes gene_type:complete